MSKHISAAHAASKKIAANDQSDQAVDALGSGTPVTEVMAQFPKADWQGIADFAGMMGDPTNPSKHTVADAINRALTKQAA